MKTFYKKFKYDESALLQATLIVLLDQESKDILSC